MTKLESGAAATRRARSDFDSYSDSILLNEREAGAVSGVSHNTLKFWRLKGKKKGPRPVYLHGMVRYEVGEIRRWRTETRTDISANTRDSTDQIHRLPTPNSARELPSRS
jgi:predicted DNA-binding transcriptional regulator AlpA